MQMTRLLPFELGALVLAGGCSGGDLTLPSASAPAELVLVSGDDQRAEPGALLPDPLLVRVVDEGARPVRGVPVKFSFVGDVAGAALDPAAILTDDEGLAASAARLGEDPGEQLIVAQVDAPTLSALRTQFTATAVRPDNDGGRGGGKHLGRGGGEDGDGSD